MLTRRIPGTELALSEIGFGCGGNAGLMVRGTAAQQVEIVARALDLGVNYFDTAPDYGNGVAEVALGRALKTLKRRALVTTKVEIRAANLGDIASHVVRSAEESLRRLGLDAIDFIQVHNGPSLEPPPQAATSYERLWLEDFLRPGGALEGLRRLQRDGKARYLGFCCRGNDRVAVETLLSTGLFKLLNTPYTLLNPTAGMLGPPGFVVAPDYGDVIGAARARGAGIAVYSPLAGGALTLERLRGMPLHPLARPDLATPLVGRDNARARAVANAFDGEDGLTRLAYRFVLSHPGVTSVVGGFSDIRQLEEVVRAAAAGRFSPDEVRRLETVWRSSFGEEQTTQAVGDHGHPRDA